MTESVLAFFDLGEHGVYVWSAWGLALMALACLALTPWLRWRSFLKRASPPENPLDDGKD